MNTSTIALIEIGGSHDECLLSQMHAIKSTGRKILLITSPQVVQRNPEFMEYLDDRLLVDMSGSSSERAKEVSRIWKKVKASKCEKVVLNTAEGNLVRSLSLKALFSKIQFIGIVHSTRKFENSFTQKIINKKIKKYLMLSENLVNSITPPSGVRVNYFYPIRYSTQKTTAEKTGHAKDHRKTVVIIGGVENRRKDLSGFLTLVESIKRDELKFIFLGKSDEKLDDVQEFQREIEERKVSDLLKTYDHFVSQEEFDAQVQNADLIMPIVHPNTKSAEEYFKSRMSGAMSVSFGYKVPMLIHEGYEQINEMKAASFYYNFENFETVLFSALEAADTKKAEMKAHEAYNVEFQEQRYLKFLFD